MTTSSASVSMVATAYTPLSAGHATVLVHAQDGPIRVIVASELPVVGSDQWFPIEKGGQLHLESLETTANVYARSDGGTAVARVIKGP